MKLPLYLKISFALTCCLAGWTIFHDETSSGVSLNPQLNSAADRTATVKKPSAMQAGSGELADLFPVYAKPAAGTAASPVAAIPEVYFPFQLAGIWISEHEKIIIITDGMRSWLVCDRCEKPGFIKPGDSLTADWKLQTIKPDVLQFASLSGSVEKHIDLNSLKIK